MKTAQQIRRIQKMEKILNQILPQLAEIEVSLEKFEALQKDIDILEEYYKSKDWKMDFSDSESGKLPADLPTGILSEDDIWNALELRDELLQKMRDLARKKN